MGVVSFDAMELPWLFELVGTRSLGIWQSIISATMKSLNKSSSSSKVSFPSSCIVAVVSGVILDGTELLMGVSCRREACGEDTAASLISAYPSLSEVLMILEGSALSKLPCRSLILGILKASSVFMVVSERKPLFVFEAHV